MRFYILKGNVSIEEKAAGWVAGVETMLKSACSALHEQNDPPPTVGSSVSGPFFYVIVV
jgi:hypothetical protein